jgi:meiotically up-regulated gene 157 (Mug157) protein
MVASAAAPMARAQTSARLTSRRPPAAARKFVSAAVERRLQAVSATIADPDLAWLFENCWPNSLDTAVEMAGTDAEPDTFVATGDIPAMWLRDSSAQLWSYLGVARDDPHLCLLMRGLIARHARCVLIDPYANAFSRDLAVKAPLPWAANDQTEMKPGVAERKWEVDSLAHVVRFACGYWRATGDTTPFGSDWWQAMQVVVDTLRTQQRMTAPGPYRFTRNSDSPIDTLAGDGWGVPTRKIGLVHTMFRPSDDAATYPFNIPSNVLAAQSLGELAAMARAVGGKTEFAAGCDTLAGQITLALARHGVVTGSAGVPVLAYEIDGFGNALCMDDANIPGLLSLPYLGCRASDDPLYQATRAQLLSSDDPYFFRGRVAEGIGGPHVGPGMIWPMGIIMRAMTSRDDREIAQCLAALKRSSNGSGFMHESFDADDAGHFTRPWFAWVNGLFGELILHLATEKPQLLGRQF